MAPKLRTREEILNNWIQSVTTYTDQLTWFGANSVTRALGWAFAIDVESTYLLYVALIRRYTVMNATGEDLSAAAAERGTTRLGAAHARALVVVVPESANVANIRTSAGDDYIEIDDSSFFLATDSFRIRNADGTVAEVATVASISAGTGPINGDDELVVTGGLSNAYTPASEDVDVLIRVTSATDTSLSSTAGVSFQLLEAVTTGDANAVLDGEGTALSLADKAWAECTIAGASGNVEPLTISSFSSGAVRGIKQIYNPERGVGGDPIETDLSLKYRTTHRPTLGNAETLAWLEALARAGNNDVLRAVQTDDLVLRTLTAKVMHRNGGTFTTAELTTLGAYIAARSRSYMEVQLTNITLTAVEVEAQITIDADTTLEVVWRAAASKLATFLDYRKWDFGTDVDEADLLSLVKGTNGVASLVTSSFLPASDVVVGVESLPSLVRLSLQDTATGLTINNTLAASF